MSEQAERLRDLVAQMRRIAVPVDPLHGWWDTILDAEAFLAGGPTILQLDAEGWAEHCEALLAKHNTRATAEGE